MEPSLPSNRRTSEGNAADPVVALFSGSLAGIARALEDFGYRDEANRLFRVKEDLETKIAPLER